MPDTVAPVLTSLTLPAVVNVSAGPVSIPVSVGATDDLSGVQSVVLAFDKAFQTVDGLDGLFVFRDSQDSFGDGVSSGLFTISPDAAPGLYTIVVASVLDKQSNYASYSSEDLAALGLPTSFAIVSGTADTTPPRVAITSPGGVTTSPLQTIQGTLGAEDAGATVTILDGASVVGSATASSSGAWSTTVTFAADGTHTVTALAADLSGNIGTSGPVTFTLTPDLSANKPLFGAVVHDTQSAGAQIYALYDGLLGRAPDTAGLEYWAAAFLKGASPASLAGGFLGSPEGLARAGAADDATFVTQLFNATLHRAPDAAGLAYWTDTLAHGASRADVGVGFALSAEHLASLQPVLDAGLFVPDQDASAVARIYYTVLSRAPDAAGLQFWTNAIKAGTPLAAETQSFLDTPEAQAKTASLTTAQYVDLVYTNALGRHAEADGLGFWTNAIDSHAASRVDVTTQIGQSSEAQAHFAPVIEQGWHLA